MTLKEKIKWIIIALIILLAICSYVIVSLMYVTPSPFDKQSCLDDSSVQCVTSNCKQYCSENNKKDYCSLQKVDINQDGELQEENELLYCWQHPLNAECDIICEPKRCDIEDKNCDRTCETDEDCFLSCSCGCISKSEICMDDVAAYCTEDPCRECRCDLGRCTSYNLCE